eukprot:12405748-Karenia_brevis.AAC.1
MFNVPHPTFPARHVILSIEPKSKTKVQIIFSGNPKPLRESLVKAGFKLASVQIEDEAYQQYFR